MTLFYIIKDGPQIGQSGSGWENVLNTVCLFLYVVCDNCDGKQARKTNTSSPLGFLLDHGLDSVVTPFVALNIFCLFGLDGQMFFLLSIISAVGFYFVTYEQ